MRLPPLTADKSLITLQVWFKGSSGSMSAGVPMSVSDLECIQSGGENTLYCLSCPWIFAGCLHPAS